jgi:hypothetical protein
MYTREDIDHHDVRTPAGPREMSTITFQSRCFKGADVELQRILNVIGS